MSKKYPLLLNLITIIVFLSIGTIILSSFSSQKSDIQTKLLSTLGIRTSKEHLDSKDIDNTKSLENYLNARDEKEKLSYVPGEIIVKVNNRAIFFKNKEALSRKINAPDLYAQKLTNNYYLLKSTVIANDVESRIPFDLTNFFNKYDSTTKDAINILKKESSIVSAAPNSYATALAVPNDTYFSNQWALNNTGQGGGTPDADIDAPEAWEIEQGSSDVTIAVIDTGIDTDHDDLKQNIWINTDEIPDNKIDDDNNGFVDDIHGVNFVESIDINEDGDMQDFFKQAIDPTFNWPKKVYCEWIINSDFNDNGKQKECFKEDPLNGEYFESIELFDLNHDGDLFDMYSITEEIDSCEPKFQKDIDKDGYQDNCYTETTPQNADYKETNVVIEDDRGHGTHVAGIAAARSNNNRDVAGVCPNCKIMPVKFLKSNGTGSVADGILAIKYAVDNDADVLNNSWGTLAENNKAPIQEIVNYANDNESLFVAGAGNSGKSDSCGDKINYPAANDGVLTVAATDNTDHKSSYSSCGNYVDISAPGGDHDPDNTCYNPKEKAILSSVSDGIIWDSSNLDTTTINVNKAFYNAFKTNPPINTQKIGQSFTPEKTGELEYIEVCSSDSTEITSQLIEGKAVEPDAGHQLLGNSVKTEKSPYFPCSFYNQEGHIIRLHFDNVNLTSGNQYTFTIYSDGQPFNYFYLTDSDGHPGGSYYRNGWKDTDDIGFRTFVNQCTQRDNDGNRYTSIVGTSMAAPHVSGAAGLYISKYSNASYESIKHNLIQTTDKIPSDEISRNKMGSGRLNLNSLITLRGRNFEVTPYQLDFGVVTDLTLPTIKNLKVENMTNKRLYLDIHTSNGHVFKIPTNSLILSAYETKKIAIRFTPQEKEWGMYDKDYIKIEGTETFNKKKISIVANYKRSLQEKEQILGYNHYSYQDLIDFDRDSDLDILLDPDDYHPIKGQNYIGEGFQRFFPDHFFESSEIFPNTTMDDELGDYDNDGDYDLLAYDQEARQIKIFECINPSLPRYKDTGYSLGEGDLSTRWTLSWNDYDSDGDLDILIARNQNVPYLYRNDGKNLQTGKWIFTQDNLESNLDIMETTLFIKLNSRTIATKLTWGDFNNDGLSDLLYQSREDGPVLYKNMGRQDNGKILFEKTDNEFDGLTLLVTGKWGDFDMDGDLDIHRSGGFDSDKGVNLLYQNHFKETNTKYFSEDERVLTNPVKAVDEANWGDYDDDGDLDLFLSTGNYYFVKLNLYKNNITKYPNTPPDTPTSLNTSMKNNDITFSWQAATDAETNQKGLTYNLRVGTTPGGNEILNSNSNPDGYYRLATRGNVDQNLSYTLHDVDIEKYGRIYWSVQAIDNNYAGSPFAEDQIFPPILHVSRVHGSDETGTGSKTHPFKSIGKALETSPYPLTTINVARGTYSEAFEVPEAVEIRGGWDDDFSKRKPWNYKSNIIGIENFDISYNNFHTQIDASVVLNSGSKIDGFHIYGNKEYRQNNRGVLIKPESTYYEIRNCDISRYNTGIGNIWFDNETIGDIVHNLIRDNMNAVTLHNSNHTTISLNTIAAYKKDDNFNSGILIEKDNSDNVAIGYNVFENLKYCVSRTGGNISNIVYNNFDPDCINRNVNIDSTNILKDPKLRNNGDNISQISDFYLTKNSPARGAGPNGSDLGAFPYVDPHPKKIMQIVFEDLAQKLDIQLFDIKLVSKEYIIWPDNCLGAPGKGEQCAGKNVPGFIIILKARGENYKYHTDLKIRFRYIGKVGQILNGGEPKSQNSPAKTVASTSHAIIKFFKRKEE